MLWNGSAASCIDLQNVLPAMYVSSDAYSMSGNTVYGIATDASGNNYAVTWTVTVPEPASVVTWAVPAAITLLCLRRRAGFFSAWA